MNRFIPTLVTADQVTLDDWCLFGDEYFQLSEIIKKENGVATLMFEAPSRYNVALTVHESTILTIYTQLIV